MNDAFVLKGRVEIDTSGLDDGLDKVSEKLKKTKDDGAKYGGEAGTAWGTAFGTFAGNVASKVLNEAWELTRKVVSESINLASDMEQIQNVVDETFEDGAKQINAWAKSSISAFGMSELRAKKYVSTMGAMLKSMGLTDAAVEDMSTSLVTLAGDMASFYNMDHEEIMTKIRSGFAGEIEPLRQLGINMSVANLEAFAMSRGIDKAYKSMTQAEQATLRYQYLLEATADAQGDFTRTSLDYANQVNILKGHMQEIGTEIGKTLIDAINPALIELNKWLDGGENNNAIMKQFETIEETEQSEIGDAVGANFRANTLINFLESLGDETERTDEEQRAWLNTLKELVKIMPELAQYVDLTTGALLVSTGELRGFAESATERAIAKAKANAMKSQQDALNTAYETWGVAWYDLELAKQDEKMWWDKFDGGSANIANAIGWSQEDVAAAINSSFGYMRTSLEYAIDNLNIGDDAKAQLKADLSYLYDVSDSAITASENVENLTKEFENHADQLNQAEGAYEQRYKAMTEAERAVLDSITAEEQFTNALNNQHEALTSVSAAASELNEYYADLKESARGALDSVAGSLTSELKPAEVDMEDIRINMGLKNSMFTDYAQNIQQAMAEGMDENLLAYLTADPNAENMAILDQWLNSNDEDRNLFTSAFKGLEEAKDAAATQMANAQTAVDENFQGMAEELNAMVDEFNKSDEISAELAKNDFAIDTGMQAMATTLQNGVNNLNSILSGLPGAVSLNFSLGGTTDGDEGVTPGSNAKGLGYVPYDNYLTYLHRGEYVMSRAEAENWRRGASDMNAGIDYDRLAAVLASNMAGMAMQMDGKTIGALIAPVVSRAIENDAYRGRY